MVMTDCFAYPGKHKRDCMALKEFLCRKGECPFYRPKSEVEEQDKKVKRELIIVKGESIEKRCTKM